MKKLMLFTLFSLLSLWASAQFIATNNSTSKLTVGVQLQSIANPCIAVTGMIQVISPGASYIFPVPQGMQVMRVGAGTSGTNGGWEYSPCATTCGSSKPGPITFMWNGPCRNLTEVNIYY